MTTHRNKISFGLYLEPEQLDGLRALSRRLDTPIAELVRIAINSMLHPGPAEMVAALERVCPGFCARLSPAEREQLVLVLAAP